MSRIKSAKAYATGADPNTATDEEINQQYTEQAQATAADIAANTTPGSTKPLPQIVGEVMDEAGNYWVEKAVEQTEGGQQFKKEDAKAEAVRADVVHKQTVDGKEEARRQLGNQKAAAKREAQKKAQAAARRKAARDAAAKKKLLWANGDPTLFAKFERQTDQNYIALNMIPFSDLSQKPSPSSLENLMLVSRYEGNLINKLTTSSKLGPLMCASPYELSQLTPTFHIYKKKGKKLEEFQFMDHLKWSYKTDSGESRILNSSMGQGVGFKKFNWESTGTNMFSAPRTLIATLTLHFQSISELARSARLDEGDGGVRWIDLIVPPMGVGSVIPEGCPTGIPPVDEILQKSMTPEQLMKYNNDPKEREYMGAAFSLMVEVGWKYGINSTLSQEFRAAADASLMLLDLTMTSHDFKFREDGTIDLDVHYVARMEGLMDDYSANIFNLTAEGKNEKIFEELDALKQEIKTMETTIDSPTGVFACAERGNLNARQTRQLDKKAQQVDKKIEKLETEAAALTKQLKLSIYGRFTEYLLSSHNLFFIDVPKADYALGNTPKPEDVQDARAHQNEEGFRKTKKQPNGSWLTQMNASDDLSNPSAGDVRRLTSRSGETKGEVRADKVLDKVNASWSATAQLDEDVYKRVSFFYLGDLINFYAGVLPGIKEVGNKEIEKFEIILGDLIFLDYKSIGDLLVKGEFKSLSDPDMTDAEKSQMAESRRTFLNERREQVVSNPDTYVISRNMAHIPISFDAYTTWFTETVVNGDSVLTFKSFIESVTTKLVLSALEAADNEYVNEDLRRTLKERTQVKAGVVAGRNDSLVRGCLNIENPQVAATGESSLLIRRAPMSLTPQWKDDNVNGAPQDVHPNKQFFVLYINRLPHASQRVDEMQNAKEGIYHLKIGASAGLVKTIGLKKEANQRIRDANIMRAYNAGGSGLGIIQEPYNATVKLFGGGFFQPGQYVYINPTNIGLGTQHERYSIARQLGVGGFYIITKVSTSVSEGKLETTLKCIFQNYGYLEGTDSNSSVEPKHEIFSWKSVGFTPDPDVTIGSVLPPGEWVDGEYVPLGDELITKPPRSSKGGECGKPPERRVVLDTSTDAAPVVSTGQAGSGRLLTGMGGDVGVG